MLFIDFSSTFNELGLSTPFCNWILDFLLERPQTVQVSSNISNAIRVSTGVPQGCILSPLLFALLTHDCTATHG